MGRTTISEEKIKKKIKTQSDTKKGSNLASYLENVSGNENSSGTELGMHYLNFLTEASKEAGVSFDARVTFDDYRYETTSTISLRF